MPEILPRFPLLAAFLLASLVLAVTPGPGVFYIVTRSLAQGRRAGLASVGGVALGNFGNALGASLGLAALFAASSAAFVVVKYAGAAYLVYLGVQALFSRVSTKRGLIEAGSVAEAPDQTASRRDAATSNASMTVGFSDRRTPRLRKLFRDGFIVALLNPKTAIFFAAFLPQFMNPTASPALQSVLLGAIFVAIAATTDTAYALAAGAISPALSRARGIRRIGRYASGGAFIGLGVYTALSYARAAK